MFAVCVLQSEPFNGQGSLPSGGAGGYNAFTQAAVNGVSHGRTWLCPLLNHWVIRTQFCMMKFFKHSSSSSLSQVGVEWCPDIPAHQWEGIPRLRWHRGRPYLPTCPRARTQNPPTSHRTPNPTSTPSRSLQVRHHSAVNTRGGYR